MPAATAGAVTSFALTTTCIAEVSAGNASLTRLNVCTTGSSCGSVSASAGCPCCIWIAGIARATISGGRQPGGQPGAAQDAVDDPRPDPDAGHPAP